MIAALLLTVATLWQSVEADISFAPTSVTVPSINTRRVLLKVGDVVALYEYDCRRQTAAMLYVMRPGREPYAAGELVRTPHTYGPDSAHGIITRTVCGKGMV